jgi:hypothetical protein
VSGESGSATGPGIPSSEELAMMAFRDISHNPEAATALLMLALLREMMALNKRLDDIGAALWRKTQL